MPRRAGRSRRTPVLRVAEPTPAADAVIVVRSSADARLSRLRRARLFAYASAGGMSLPLPSLQRQGAEDAGPFPLYRDAEVVSAPEADDDHPDELSYVPFEIAGLMTDASVTYSRTVAPLTHPEQGNIDYLFEDMDQPTAFTLPQELGL